MLLKEGVNTHLGTMCTGQTLVRVALGKLFFDKCGYCEYKLARTDLNIDHYRPKGRVAEAKEPPRLLLARV